MKQILLDKPLGSLVRLDWEKGLYVVLIILALSTRLWGLGDRVQSHDESIHTKYSWNLYAGYGFQHNPLMHGPFLFHATALSYFLFDDNDFSARLPVALMGVAIVAFPYLLRHWLGRAGALVTSFFLLISPSIAYYSRYIRHDIPIMLWALVVVFAILSYLRDGRERWLYLMAAGVSLMFATKEVAFIYSAIFGLFLVGLFAVQAMGREWSSERLRPAFLVSVAVMAAGVFVLGLGLGLRQEDQPGLARWAITAGMVAGLALLGALACLLGGTWRSLRDDRVFDLIVVLGTLCLPFLSPVLIQVAGLDPMDYSGPAVYTSGAIVGAVLVVSAVVGLVWNWRRWSIAAAIHYAIFVVLFTTVFTNGTGIASGMVGSLGYWLAQQEVERGGQPWYYYMVMVPLYEYLPLLLTLVTPVYLALRPADRRRPTANLQPPISNLQSPFIPFVLWWALLAWIGYSYAGEKMPWLTVHLALPMILLAGWLVGQLIEGTDWRRVRERRAWLLALVAPPFVMAVVMGVHAARAGAFQGYELGQLDATGRFLGGLVGALAFGAGLGYLAWRSGWRVAVRVLLLIALVVPVLLTLRTAWRFCYVNYDYPTEFLVYAHSAPAVKETMRQIEDLSRRTAGGPNLLPVAYGSDGSTLFYWFLRDYPNARFYSETPSREQMESPVVIAGRDQWEAVTPYLANDYLVNTYTYLWWPMEDYRNLSWASITRAITDTQTQAALWDIWYDRDYRRYDELTGKKHTLDEWPLRAEYRLYIRRDVAAQTWDLSTTGPTEIGPTDPYADGWRDVAARQEFGSPGVEPGQLQSPRGIKVGPDGSVYVADSGNHRIQKFTADGEFVAAWGRNSTVEAEMGMVEGFNEPWDVAVAPGGEVYVADTWNHRMQKFSPGGEFLMQFGEYGKPVGNDEGDGLFRATFGVAVDSEGSIYVSDYNNNRIQKFGPDGKFLTKWGIKGRQEGQLDHPAGLAVDSQDRLYVADLGNNRVQRFSKEGDFEAKWGKGGTEPGEFDRPYDVCVDGEGNVYVADLGNHRIQKFTDRGKPVYVYGELGTGEGELDCPMSVAVDRANFVYVADWGNNRVQKFAPAS